MYFCINLCTCMIMSLLYFMRGEVVQPASSAYTSPVQIPLQVSQRGGGLGSSTIVKKFNEPYAPS